MENRVRMTVLAVGLSTSGTTVLLFTKAVLLRTDVLPPLIVPQNPRAAFPRVTTAVVSRTKNKNGMKKARFHRFFFVFHWKTSDFGVDSVVFAIGKRLVFY